MIDICRICGDGLHLREPAVSDQLPSKDHRFKRAKERSRRYVELTGGDPRGFEVSSRHPKKGWKSNSL